MNDFQFRKQWYDVLKQADYEQFKDLMMTFLDNWYDALDVAYRMETDSDLALDEDAMETLVKVDEVLTKFLKRYKRKKVSGKKKDIQVVEL